MRPRTEPRRKAVTSRAGDSFHKTGIIFKDLKFAQFLFLVHHTVHCLVLCILQHKGLHFLSVRKSSPCLNYWSVRDPVVMFSMIFLGTDLDDLQHWSDCDLDLEPVTPGWFRQVGAWRFTNTPCFQACYRKTHMGCFTLHVQFFSTYISNNIH